MTIKNILDHHSCACSKINDQHNDHKTSESFVLKFFPSKLAATNDSIIRGDQAESTNDKFSCNNNDRYDR